MIKATTVAERTNNNWIKPTIIIGVCVVIFWLCYNENSRLAMKTFFKQMLKAI